MDLLLALAATAGLLALNAFFVLAEFAVLKVRASRLEELSLRGASGAANVKQITRNLDAYLSAIQLGITMASLGIGWLGEPAVARLIHPLVEPLPIAWSKTATHTLSFGLAFGAITFLHVVLGEQAPKLVAIRYPTQAALLSAKPLQLFYRLVYLPMAVLNGATNLLLRLSGLQRPDESDAAHSEAELRILLSFAQERGVLPLSRLLLFENLFDFGGLKVRDIMTPAAGTHFLSIEKPWAENLETLRRHRHTRYPLVGKDLTEVKGVVHAKDILLSGGPEPDLPSLKREPVWLAETAPLEKALGELRGRRSHLALVRSAAGSVVGVLTLEDVLEELVGEIHDEFESAPQGTLSQAVVPEAVEVGLPSMGKQEAIRRLIRGLAAARPELEAQRCWEVVWKREKALTSAVGGGVALPHGRLAELSAPVVALGQFPKGTEYDAPDKKPVQLVFLLLTPLKDPTAQLRLLSRIAAVVSHRVSRRNLLRARSAREAVDVIAAFEQGVAE